MAILDDILGRFDAAQQAANAANEQRYQQLLDLANQEIEMYKTGGSFGKGVEKQIETSGKKAVASGMQSLVSSGLANTTVAAGLRKNWESEVGSQARLNLEDLRMERLSQALNKKQGIIERREDVGPSLESVAQLAMSAASGIPTDFTGRNTFGASGFRTETDQARRDAEWQARQASDAAKYTEWQNTPVQTSVSPVSVNSVYQSQSTPTSQMRMTDEEIQDLIRRQPKQGKWVAGW